MLFRILVTIAIATPLLPSCKTLSNNFSDLKSDCGSDVVYGGDYLKFLSPSGVELSGSELSGMSLAQNKRTESPRFTQKGCALKSELDAVAVRSSVKDRHWGVVVSDSDKRTASSLRLKDISSWNPKFECPKDTLTKGSIRSPLSWDLNLASTLPQYAVGDRNNLRVVDSVRDQDIDLGFLENDGEHELEFTWLDPYQGTKSAKCKYQLDRTAPTLTDELNQLDETKQYRVSGGSRLRLAVQDSHAASLEYCLYRPGETCQLLKAGPETFVTFPSAGHWCIKSTGIDQAGNRSETQLKCGISIAEGELALLLANLQNAKHYEPTVPLLQPILILRALKQYFALQTDEERQSVKNEMLSAAVSYGAQTYLRGMYKERRFDTMMKFSDSWGTETDGKFEIRNEYGRVLAKQNFADLGLQDISSKGNQLINYDGNEVKLFEVGSDTLELKQRTTFPQIDTPRSVLITWNPWNDSFAISEVHSISDGSVKKSQYSFHFFQKDSHGPFKLDSSLNIPDGLVSGDSSGIEVKAMHWSGDGQFAAVSTRLQSIIFKRNSENKFELMKVIEGSNRDLVILQDGFSSLLLITDEQNEVNVFDLTTMQQVENDLKLKANYNYNNNTFLQTDKTSTYVYDGGIDRIMNESGKIVVQHVSGEVQNIERSFWNFHPSDSLTTYQSFRDLTFYRNKEKTLEKLGVVPFDTPVAHRPYGALPYVHLNHLFLTSSDDGILRTWAPEPLVGKVVSSNTDSTPEITDLLREFLPTHGEIPYWVFPRLEPYSKTNHWTGKDRVSKIFRSPFNTDFMTLSAHDAVKFYDVSGNDIGTLEAKGLDFKKYSVVFTDADHLLIINEDLEYQIIEKHNSKYHEVFRGNSKSANSTFTLKPTDLLKFAPSENNANILEVGKSLIKSNSDLNFIAVKARKDLRFIGTIDELRKVSIYELKDGIYLEFDRLSADWDVNSLEWESDQGPLFIRMSSNKTMRYDPDSKSSSVHNVPYAISNDKAVFYDGSLNISHQFQISFLGSTLSEFDFAQTRAALAFSLTPTFNNELISDDSIIKQARGIDGRYILTTDLSKIHKEMCDGLRHFLKNNLVVEDWENLRDSDKNLCEENGRMN